MKCFQMQDTATKSLHNLRPHKQKHSSSLATACWKKNERNKLIGYDKTNDLPTLPSKYGPAYWICTHGREWITAQYKERSSGEQKTTIWKFVCMHRVRNIPQSPTPNTGVYLRTCLMNLPDQTSWIIMQIARFILGLYPRTSTAGFSHGTFPGDIPI